MPVIAILQKSNKLIGIDAVLHSYDWPHVQFTEFPLTQKPGSTKNLCFVAFPTTPSSVEPQKLKQYLNSIKAMKKEKEKFALVIELPYSFDSAESIWDSFKVILETQP